MILIVVFLSKFLSHSRLKLFALCVCALRHHDAEYCSVTNTLYAAHYVYMCCSHHDKECYSETSALFAAQYVP